MRFSWLGAFGALVLASPSIARQNDAALVGATVQDQIAHADDPMGKGESGALRFAGSGSPAAELFVTSDPRRDVAALDDIRSVSHEGRMVDAAAIERRRSARPVSIQPTDAPKLFAPETEWPAGSDASPAFTPDGRTVFFTHAIGAARTIMISRLRDGAWSKPAVASFSGTWRDIEPAMAPDGSYLVFISSRPAASGGEPLTGFWGGEARPAAGGNIWRVNRDGEGWSEPTRLPDIVNSNSAIYSPALARDGSVYFNQPDPVTTKSHIYRAQSIGNRYSAPVALPFNHGESGDYDTAVAPDESFIVFSSGRAPAPANQSILFVSFQQNGSWTTPQAFQPLTAGLEARLSPDLKTLYFSADVPLPNTASNDAVAASRIFQIPLHL